MSEQSATKNAATPETATAKRTTWAWIPYERDQQLRFSCLDAVIPEDDPVRLVDEVLDRCAKEGVNTVRAIFPEKNEKLRKNVVNLGFHRSPIANYDITLES